MLGIIKNNVYCIIIASNHTKCVLLCNRQCILQPTLTNLHPNEYSASC